MTNGSTLITVRVSNETARRLADLANTTARSKSYIAEQALEKYLALHE